MLFRCVRTLAVPILVAFMCVHSAHAVEGKKAESPAELLSKIKYGADQDAVLVAIRALSGITEADERSLAVAEFLTALVVNTTNPFYAKAAVQTLSTLQANITKRPKTKYILEFMTILKNTKAMPPVRSAIADCFRQTLDKDELKDRDAFAVLKAVAQSKTEPNVSLRANCIEAIGGFGDADNIVMLCDLLSDSDTSIKEAAANAVVVLLDKAPSASGTVSLGATNRIVEMVNDDKLSVDLRVVVIRAAAKLMAAGAPGANKALETIIKLVKNASDDKLVMGSIEALGIVGTAQSVDPLIQTYKDFSNTANMMNEKDVPIRAAITKALRSVLMTQANRATSDMPTVHKVVVALIAVVDNDPAIPVKQAAINALAYLYPPKFAAERKEAALALVFLMAKNDTSADMKAAIAESLEFILGVNFRVNVDRWKEYLQKTFGVRP
ncbi:MAG: hypothetical protein WCT04_23765 [Planctomycetota bacterium]